MAEEIVYTVSEAQRLLRVSRNLIYQLVRDNALPGIIRLPGSKRILIARKPFDDMIASGINPMERDNGNQS